MRQGEYDPSRQSPFRAAGHASPQYVGSRDAGPASALGAPTAQYWAPGQQPPLRQSGAGIASFALALLSGFTLISLVATLGVLASGSGGKLDEKSGMAIALGLGIIAGTILSVVGAILGLVAVLQKDRKKMFAVLGLTLNGLIVLGVAGMIVIGLVAA